MPHGSPGSISKRFWPCCRAGCIFNHEPGSRGWSQHPPWESGAECVWGRGKPPVPFGELISKTQPSPRDP